MTDLWCVKGNVNDGQTFVSADAAEISPHGELAFYRENGRRSLVLAFAPAIAKATNLSRQTVYRIKDNPAAAELATWEA
jgi:hypothetical protein